MITAAVYGMLASSGLLVGVLIGLVTAPPRRLVAAVIAFGSGVLVSVLTFDLMGKAFALGSPAFVIVGFLIGALLYVVADMLLERMAACAPKREGPDRRDGARAAIGGTALLVGAVLDGIPESLCSAVGMRQEGHSRRHVVVVWAAAAVACTLASVVGYALLGGLSPNLIGALLALAAGGILAMLADTMMPDAFENGGPLVAMTTAVGFACAFLLSHIAG